MSTPLIPIITSDGLAAVFNLTNDGFEGKITEMALGDTAWDPDDTATDLQNEIARIPVTGERIAPHQVHISANEDGAVEYWVREIAFYLEDGTLLCLWSNSTKVLAYKSADVDLILSLDLVLDALPANSITIDGTAGFNLPAASETKRGIIQLATPPEAVQGVDLVKGMTPYTTKAAISLPFALLEYPETLTADNKLAITPAAATDGGTVSVVAGDTIFLGVETEAGLGYSQAFALPDFVSADLPVNSTLFLRCQIVNGAPVLYTQEGADDDAIPASLKGTPDDVSGGGFDSTQLDLLAAKIETGAAGSVPVVTALKNRRQLKLRSHHEYAYHGSGAGDWVATPPLTINWARLPTSAVPSMAGFKNVSGGDWESSITPDNTNTIYKAAIEATTLDRYGVNGQIVWVDTPSPGGTIMADWLIET